jgi:5-methyltetrahydropteroyltriglutamate--homocysteine methyltransferase
MFDVTTVGSWPRSQELLKALRARQKGRMSREDFARIADDEVRSCVARQEQAGVDVVTDGEHHRDNFYSFVTDKLEGTELMSLAEMLDTVEDKSSFDEMLATLDVPASAIKNPTCTGRLERREPLAVDELRFVQELTDTPVKVTLPGPYLLTRSMWVNGHSDRAYGDKTEMGDDVVRILHDELVDLRDAGAAIVQFDEPVLTEIVMGEDCDRRTFM